MEYWPVLDSPLLKAMPGMINSQSTTLQTDIDQLEADEERYSNQVS